MLKCTRCKLSKKNYEFRKNKSIKGRYFDRYCKGCRKILDSTKYKDTIKNSKKKFYTENKKTIIENTNKYNRSRDNGLYYKYLSAVNRCTQKSLYSYRWYGAKGIKVLWTSYKDFKRDMYKGYISHIKKYGKKNTYLSRKDLSKNFSKENCIWSSEGNRGIKNTWNPKYKKDETLRKNIIKKFKK